jgi:hypothetical protein
MASLYVPGIYTQMRMHSFLLSRRSKSRRSKRMEINMDVNE